MRSLLWLSILASTALRLLLLSAGPDLDTDAYGHAMAGRFLLDTPLDLRIHWVWLPLWHAVHGGIAALGGGLQEARLLNIALGALAPWLLDRLLREATGDGWLGAVGGALLALWPLGLGLGQSAQPEPLFQVLLLGACLCWERGRPGWTGALLSCAALCRYEAWVLPPVFLALGWRGARARALAWLLPGATLCAWCVAHRAATGEWLQFLRLNQEFAREASQRLGFPWGPEPSLWRMALWYPVLQPAYDLQVFAPLPFLGAAVAWRRRGEGPLPGALVATSAAVLLFLSYGWMRRLNLGLPRHFFALVPLYASLAAAGALALARRLQGAWATRALGGVLLLFLVVRTAPVARWTFHRSRAHLLPERAATAALRGARLQGADRVVCDLPEVELLARLPRGQMVRRRASSLGPGEAGGLAPGGRLFVVARPAEVRALRGELEVLQESAEVVVLGTREAGT
ncbi:MAG: DUF2029 domain-containing protein [Polyangiaceae bacterium]|jgi:hypothetical protein|nr:DUF2029 domain-containing protein [Polyangiaceae bacterium]